MKKAITKRQKQLLWIIYKYIGDIGYPPTFEEMREKLGVSSNQSIIDLLNKLTNGGFIKRESGARSLVILSLGYSALNKPPLVAFAGTTSAGAPVEAIEISGEWRQMSSEVSRFASEVFMLKISGDSMINAGIDDGDVVLVKSEKEFVSGDIVLARIGDESTIKRFISEDKPSHVYLKPENSKYENIIITEEVKLEGKVISVLKNNYWISVK